MMALTTEETYKMKWALLSDIHANQQALQACMTHAQTQGVEKWAVLGDMVGYGADPCAVLETIMALHDKGAVVLQGNHDAMAVSPPQAEGSLGAVTAAWTYQQLAPAYRRFLAHAPLTQRVGHMLLVHASAHQPKDWRYIDNERSAQQCLDAASKEEAHTHVFVGHVHHQSLYYQGSGRGLMSFVPTPGVPVPVMRHRSWIATVGSVGQPRDGDTRAMYAIYDDTVSRITFHRVAYDHAAAANAIRRAGLPEYFASRLEEGR
jgi:diadenosine tetraphosphatase ApaH/serine/threonine PP2A family protein phosphatase